jgi:hypothetical protein
MSIPQPDLDCEDLLVQHITLDPTRPSPDRARIAQTGVSVWVLISYLQSVGWDVARTARAYDLPD